MSPAVHGPNDGKVSESEQEVVGAGGDSYIKIYVAK